MLLDTFDELVQLFLETVAQLLHGFLNPVDDHFKAFLADEGVPVPRLYVVDFLANGRCRLTELMADGIRSTEAIALHVLDVALYVIDLGVHVVTNLFLDTADFPCQLDCVGNDGEGSSCANVYGRFIDHLRCPALALNDPSDILKASKPPDSFRQQFGAVLEIAQGGVAVLA